MTDTPAHTPLPEPVAWINPIDAKSATRRVEVSKTPDTKHPEPLFSEAQMRVLADRLAEAEKERGRLVRERDKAQGKCDQLDIELGEMMDRAEAAEARLKQAVEVMTPFAALADQPLEIISKGSLRASIDTDNFRAARAFIKEQTDADK